MRSRRREEGRAALWRTLALCAALLSGPVACGGAGPDGATDGTELSPQELGRLGGRIHAEPERSAEVLAQAGLTAEDFEGRVREVTADPDASRAYAEGFREAAGQATERPVDGS